MTQITTVERVRQLQRERKFEESVDILDRTPDALLIGCIDARKDPHRDLGVHYGYLFIKRNVAAFISGDSADDAAALEVVTNGKVKDIVVMGHTDCRAINAFCHQYPDYPDTCALLEPLAAKRAALAGGEEHEQLRELEREAVRRSVENIKRYPKVQEAMKNGLQVHGWVLDIRSKEIQELQPGGAFVSMAGAKSYSCVTQENNSS